MTRVMSVDGARIKAKWRGVPNQTNNIMQIINLSL